MAGRAKHKRNGAAVSISGMAAGEAIPLMAKPDLTGETAGYLRYPRNAVEGCQGVYYTLLHGFI